MGGFCSFDFFAHICQQERQLKITVTYNAHSHRNTRKYKKKEKRKTKQDKKDQRWADLYEVSPKLT